MFTPEQLRAKGYVQNESGEWIKTDMAKLQKPKPKRQKGEALGRETKRAKKRRSSTKPWVTIISLRAGTPLDRDNLIGGCKSLRDAIAEELGLDDAEKYIKWSYYQLRVESRVEEGTIVKIFQPQ